MPDEPVDGFADVPANEQKTGDPHDEIPGPPDPGAEKGAKDPLDAETRAKMEKEIREGDQEGHHGHAPK